MFSVIADIILLK